MIDAVLPIVSIPRISIPVANISVIGGQESGWIYEQDDANSIRLANGYPLLLADGNPLLLTEGLKKVKRIKK